MLAKSLPKLVRAIPRRNFSKFKWNMYICENTDYTANIYNYNINDCTEIGSKFQSLPLGPIKLFGEIKELTTETIVFLSETMNMGWVGGIILGSFLIR